MANGTIAFDTLSTSGQISGTARSIDTDFLLNGTSKCWFDTSGGAAPQGSFNVASMTDVGTGTYKPTFSSNMADGFYAIASICDLAGYVFLDSAQATTDCQLANRTDGAGDTDSTYMGVVIHGDLA